MSDVIIIGAGITGLSCAWRLKKLGIESRILESSNRPGGVIHSERSDGYLIEHGPNSLLPAAENFALLDETELTSEIIEADRRAPRYICLNHELRQAPFGPMTVPGLLRALAEPLIRSRSPQDESVHDFFVRRVGPQAQDRLVAPFVTGIYAGDTRTLSMAATFPKLHEMERQHGSLIVGMLKSKKPKGARRGHTCSFVDGMEALPRRLARDANIIYDSGGISVGPGLEVRWSSGETKPRAVVVTAPASHANGIIERGFPDIAGLLGNVDYAPMVIATTSVPEAAFPRPLRGFGFLVPRTENLHLLGTLFSSSLFPGRAPQGRHLLTSFVGGALEREAIDWPDHRIWEIVRSELQTVLKTTSPPEPIRVVRRHHAIPQYRIGHERWLASLKDKLQRAPGLFVTGNYTEGVAVASCMETGEKTARDVAAFLRSRS